LAFIMEAEIDCKTTGMPDDAIARRVAMRVATGARAMRARAR
ncbi:MAG: DNA polymerase III subunit delta, partial [Rhodospirillales bacterium]|nr:DNA polymerase III subunit delta [Rhodospirillales bacterium]